MILQRDSKPRMRKMMSRVYWYAFVGVGRSQSVVGVWRATSVTCILSVRNPANEKHDKI